MTEMTSMEFETLDEAIVFRNEQIDRGYNAYYERCCGIIGLFYSVRYWK